MRSTTSALGDGVVGVIGRCENRVEVGDGNEGGLVLEAIDARAGDQRKLDDLVIGGRRVNHPRKRPMAPSEAVPRRGTFLKQNAEELAP